ncbi:MAG TPA: structural protein P5 [Candidatus Alistipes excrementigallinarum]|nr:structural protein P5 [Candidatus Alistipes excrementigallinarum]
MSRGMSNCNPGNIRRSRTRYKGEVRPSRDPEFKQFASLEWGYRAIFVLLHTYRVRYGLGSLDGMIARWAPPSENRTDLYLRFVAERTGLKANEPLDTSCRATMLPLAAAISLMENGVEAPRETLERGWELFRADFPA